MARSRKSARLHIALLVIAPAVLAPGLASCSTKERGGCTLPATTTPAEARPGEYVHVRSHGRSCYQDRNAPSLTLSVGDAESERVSVHPDQHGRFSTRIRIPIGAEPGELNLWLTGLECNDTDSCSGQRITLTVN